MKNRDVTSKYLVMGNYSIFISLSQKTFSLSLIMT
jgi:hypothetical protein